MAPERIQFDLLVGEQLTAGTKRKDVHKILGSSKDAVNKAVARLIRRKELSPPTPEDRRRNRQEAVSEARGGIFLLIEPYGNMGMTPAEVQIAVLKEEGIRLKNFQVRGGIQKAREKGLIRKLTEGEKADSSKNTFKERRQIRREVSSWLDARDITNNFGINTDQWGRKEWKDWIQLLAKSKNNKSLEKYQALKIETDRSQAALKILVPQLGFRLLRGDEKREVQFSIDLIQNNFICSDLSAMNKVSKIFEGEGARPLKFTYGVMLEAFWEARMQTAQGDWSWFNKYIDLGRKHGMSWFAKESFNLDRKKISHAITPPERVFKNPRYVY